MGSATIMVPIGSYCHRCVDSRGSSAASSRGLLRKTGLYSFELPRYQQHVLFLKVPRVRAGAVVVSDSLLPTTADIEMDNLMGETPALLALCSDFDWQECSRNLREEALASLKLGGGEGYIRLRKLESLMQEWLHDIVSENLLQPSRPGAAAAIALDEHFLLHSVENLRLHAHLRAAQELTETVDSTFEWETAAAELHKRLRSMDPLQSEQRLWPLWLSARKDMAHGADGLYKEAVDDHLQSSFTNEVDDEDAGNESLSTKPEEEEEDFTGSQHCSSSISKKGEVQSMLQTTGALVAGLLGMDDAVAADGSILSLKLMPASIEAATTTVVPGWLAPSVVLAFPVVTYLLFHVYHQKVNNNQYAKVTDWMFAMVASVIVANIIS